jgi:hydrogenase maturation protein HypF
MTTIKRRKLHVQGVGFRPFVYDIAARLRLVGFVRNDADDVTIEIEGDEAQLHWFFIALTANPPSMARIEAVVSKNIAASGGTCFQIVPSIRRW